MRGISSPVRWIVPPGEVSVRFVRILLPGREGRLDLDEGKALAYRWDEKGAVSIRCGLSGVLKRSFEDGAVLVRDRKEPAFHPARRPVRVLFSLPLLVSVFFGGMLFAIPRTDPAAPSSEERGVPLALSPPAPAEKAKRVTVVRRKPVARRPKALRSPPKRPAESVGQPGETAVRKMFVQGQLNEAAEHVARIERARGGELPPRLRKLAAEVDYARCRKAFAAEDWHRAAPLCGQAARRARHARANQLLKQMAELVRRSFLEGYAMEPANPAAAIARYWQVVRLAPEGDPYRTKALEKLKELQGLRSR